MENIYVTFGRQGFAPLKLAIILGGCFDMGVEYGSVYYTIKTDYLAYNS